MPFRIKLGIAFSGLLFLTIVVAVTGWWGMEGAIKSQQRLYDFNSDLERNLHLLIREEQAFILNRKLVHSNTSFNILEEMKKKINDILGVTVDHELAQTILRVLKSLDAYENSLAECFNYNIDMQTMKSRMIRESGRLFDNADELDQFGVDAISIQLLMTKALMAQKDYILEASDQKVEKVNANLLEIIRIAKILQDQTENADIKLHSYRISRLANTFLTTFNDFAVLETNFNQSIQLMKQALEEFKKEIDSYMGQEAIITQNKVQTLVILTIVISVLAILLSVMATYFLTGIIVRPINLLKKSASRILKGNLNTTVKIESNDEIGELGGIFNLMTEQLKESFDDIRNYQEHLEELVRERTKDLEKEISDRKQAQTALIQSEEKLARSKKMEALGLLAGGVAHDLNNVLSGIVSYPEILLLDLPEDSPIRVPIEKIQNSGLKAADIVQDLLTLARRGISSRNVLQLNSIISEYLDSAEFFHVSKFYSNIEIKSSLDDTLLNIEGSAVHLRKTIMNLVQNAAEAQPNGGMIQISTRNQYVDTPIQGYEDIKEGDYVVMEVKDFGSGIEKEDLNRIFEPFYTKKVMGRSGTGLGMAVVWGTVQDHQGYINVESEKGKGTIITLYFPVSRKNLSDGIEPLSLNAYIGHNETILVVDDVEEQRDIAIEILTRLKYRVTTAASGEQAVEYMKTNSADLLILDMIMPPGIDGLDTYKRVIEYHPGQKAIITSGYSETERVRQAQQLGVGEYIKKPYTFEKIGIAVKTALTG